MSIRIGNQTAFSARRVLEPFEFAIANGFTAFEFFPDPGPDGAGGWAVEHLDAATRARIRKQARDHGIELTIHAPLAFNPLQNPQDTRLHGTVALASDVGATLVNLHVDLAQGPESFVDALGPALRLTEAASLKLAIENTVWSGPADFNVLFATLRQRKDVPTAHAGMCFDLGHANLFSETHNNYWRYLDALDPGVPICHLHLHENFGDDDTHLTLFTGPARNNATGIAGLLSRLRRRRFSGCAILEQWPDPPSLLVHARDGLLNLLHAGSMAEAGRA
jgi:sugar phosphate isomerase/epimerase